MWDPRRPAPRGSFVEPVTIPATTPADGPLLYLPCNADWVPYVLGAMMQLVLPSTWATADPAAVREVQTQVTDLMAAWSAEGGDVEAGSTNVTIPAGAAEGSAEQVFAIGHTVAPIVVTGTASGDYIPSADTVSATGFRAVLTAPTPVVSDVTALVSWLAKVAT